MPQMRNRLRNMKHQQGKIRKDIPEAMRDMFSLFFDHQACKDLGICSIKDDVFSNLSCVEAVKFDFL